MQKAPIVKQLGDTLTPKVIFPRQKESTLTQKVRIQLLLAEVLMLKGVIL